MLGKLFRYKGFLWKLLNDMTDVVALSLLWAVCCLPVVTFGAATTALYDSVVRCVRFRMGHPYKRFFSTFRNNFLLSLSETLVWLPVAAAALLLSAVFGRIGEGRGHKVIAYALWFALTAVPMGGVLWVFPLHSRFTYSFSDLTGNTLRLSLGYVLNTVAMLLITALMVYIVVEFTVLSIFVPALWQLLISFLTEPAFASLGGALTVCGDDDALPEP